MVDAPLAVVADLAKLRDYCLSTNHPRGRGKARVFRSRLGLEAGDAEWLREALIDAVMTRPSELRETTSDLYGRRFVLDFELATATGTAMVRSAWMIRATEDILRLVTCYVL